MQQDGSLPNALRAPTRRHADEKACTPLPAAREVEKSWPTPTCRPTQMKTRGEVHLKGNGTPDTALQVLPKMHWWDV